MGRRCLPEEAYGRITLWQPMDATGALRWLLYNGAGIKAKIRSQQMQKQRERGGTEVLG
jgi:hypothetical protein